MAASRGITVHVVEREPEMLPFVGPLLSEWMALGFEASACRRAVHDVLRHPRSGASEALLSATSVSDGGFVATGDLLYPRADLALRFQVFDGGDTPWVATERFDAASAADVGNLLRSLADLPTAAADVATLPPRVVDELRGSQHAATGTFKPATEPGIHRREHGSVIIRSRTTAVLLDPVSYWIPHAPRPGPEIDGELAAIFITHGHADHFNVASILAHAGSAATPVVVPPVPRTSLLAASDMRATLELLGQQVQAPAWGSSLRFGDIEVDVLPYYGEQPVRDGAGPPADVRNWGSCYRFTTPDFTAIALIDSGADPLGDVVDVIRRDAEENGPADFVLSSLARFPSPFFLGLPHYYLALPFERLEVLFEQYVDRTLPSVTLGPQGVVDVCRAGTPRYYLPYGNGYEGPGQPIPDVGMHTGEPSEADVLAYLEAQFQRHDIPTEPIGWNPGDCVALRSGRAERLPFAE